MGIDGIIFRRRIDDDTSWKEAAIVCDLLNQFRNQEASTRRMIVVFANMTRSRCQRRPSASETIDKCMDSKRQLHTQGRGFRHGTRISVDGMVDSSYF